MMRIILTVFLVFFSSSFFAQSITSAYAEKFIHHLFKESDALHTYLLPEQNTIINRLGISYPDVKYKFLIANSFDARVRELIGNGDISYQYHIVPLDSLFSKIIVTVPAMNLSKEYFFKDTLLVLRPFYFSYRWYSLESKYFIIKFSNPSLTNSYAIRNLDDFVDKMLRLMKFPQSLVNQLKKEKIHYYLIEDENEFQHLTGNSAKGFYHLGGDYILTTYNNHFHEVSHLLMNYRLQNPPLYTQPFFQEGFAVGYGGRGGLAPEPVLDMGAFIMYAGFLEDTDMLSKRRFNNIDASISYPAAGFLNVRLIQKIGFTQYLNWYKQYSGNEEKINAQLIKKRDIQFEDIKKEMSLSRFDQITPVSDTAFINLKQSIKIGSFGAVKSDSNSYYFYIRTPMLVKTDAVEPGYKSNLFNELVPGKDYRGEKYIIKADENEISIYNLYTNTLIANYVKSFTGEAAAKTASLRFFKVSKTIFDENPNTWRVN